MSDIPYGKHEITKEDIDAVTEVLRSNHLTQGPMIQKFEKSFSNFISKTSSDPTPLFSLAVNNGTSALQLCCIALGVKPGDRILVASNSFVASSNCVLYEGGDVDFVDISLDHYCIDPEALLEIIQRHPAGTYKGIVVVDFAGHPVDLKKIRDIADAHHLWIIEDACHAIGAVTIESDGTRVVAGGGKYADLSVFSFHPVKHIASGEGGMITTRSRELYEKIVLYRSHGITKDPQKMLRHDGGWYYEMQELGFNFRISDILCALANSQLDRIDENLFNRRTLAKRYTELLGTLPIDLPKTYSHIEHAYHLYVIRTKKRKELYDFLHKNHILVQVHYLPIHQQPYYEQKYGPQSIKNCDQYYEECLSLPMYHSLTLEEQDRVISKITDFFSSDK
jgi:UDP-4-amino-4,6-dideoxy-N-acetyl-beta-L-altrosamine transaminase